jgi:CheY-like chemotaxis protein
LRDDVERMTRHDLKPPLNVLMGYPQLMLMDDTVCEKIRALPDYAAIPIIMITASVVKLSPQQPVFYDLQLSKPINKTDLLTALQSFLSLDMRSEITPHSHTVQTQETRFAQGGA